jgi:hypothetical protein
MKRSTFKNWHKTRTNLKDRDISQSFPVYASKNNKGGLSIRFENDKAERIVFELNEHDSHLLLMQIDKNYLGKEINRADYKLAHP